MYDVVARTLVERPSLVVKDRLSVEEIPAWLGKVYHLVSERMEETGAIPAGPPFARYTMLGDDEFFVEAGFPLTAAVEGSGQVEASILPGGPAATVWHLGPYENTEQTYRLIQQWLDEHDVAASGPPWETYYSDPTEEPDPATWRTEIVQPYVSP